MGGARWRPEDSAATPETQRPDLVPLDSAVVSGARRGVHRAAVTTGKVAGRKDGTESRASSSLVQAGRARRRLSAQPSIGSAGLSGERHVEQGEMGARCGEELGIVSGPSGVVFPAILADIGEDGGGEKLSREGSSGYCGRKSQLLRR